MEEDIKILEEIKDMFIHLKNYGWINDIKKDIDTDKAIQAIENLIKAYKELEEIEQIHRQENGELREKVKELEEENKSKQKVYDDCYCEFKHYKQYESIPVSLVKEKIEDFRNKTVWGYNDWKYAENVYKAELNIIDKLEQELLEKRK